MSESDEERAAREAREQQERDAWVAKVHELARQSDAAHGNPEGVPKGESGYDPKQPK
jgi:hypothetical protein